MNLAPGGGILKKRAETYTPACAMEFGEMEEK